MGKKFGERVHQTDIEPIINDRFLKSITLPLNLKIKKKNNSITLSKND